MFENKTEAQAREEILAMVAEYADRFHNQTKEFAPETGSPMRPEFTISRRW